MGLSIDTVLCKLDFRPCFYTENRIAVFGMEQNVTYLMQYFAINFLQTPSVLSVCSNTVQVKK